MDVSRVNTSAGVHSLLEGARFPLSALEEDQILANIKTGKGSTLLVEMFPGVGSIDFSDGQERLCLTPGLGICQAVLIASRTPGGEGRLSLTHFAPAYHVEHFRELERLSRAHRARGFTEHHVAMAFPVKDYSGRYLSPIKTQADLRSYLRRALLPLGSFTDCSLYYSHDTDSIYSRGALIAHLEGVPGGRLTVDLFGTEPVSLW